MKIFLTAAIIALSATMLSTAGTAEKKPCQGHCQKKHFENMDANKDGKISLEEWNSFHEKKFKDIDKNKDGDIDRNEFKAHRQEAMKQGRGGKCPMEDNG